VALIVAAMAKPRVLESWPKGTLVIAASVPPAILSFHLLEDPVRRSRWLAVVPRRSLALGAAIVALTLTASAAGVTLPRLDAGRAVALTAEPTATDFVPSNRDPAVVELWSERDGVAAACDLDLATPDDEPCFLGDLSSATTVAVLGDSHAGMWLPAVLAFADSHGWRLEVDVTQGCSVLYDDGRSTCDDHRAAVLDRLAREKPAVVVLVDYARHSLDRGYTLDSWSDAARDTLRRLRSSQVLLFAETPRPRGEADSCLAQHVDDVRPCEPDPGDSTFRDFFDAGHALADAEGTGFVDLLPLLCWDDRCPVIVGRTPVYYDENHLTGRFVSSITDDVVAAMDAALDELSG
jgi:hypothetical protein